LACLNQVLVYHCNFPKLNLVNSSLKSIRLFVWLELIRKNNYKPKPNFFSLEKIRSGSFSKFLFSTDSNLFFFLKHYMDHFRKVKYQENLFYKLMFSKYPFAKIRHLKKFSLSKKAFENNKKYRYLKRFDLHFNKNFFFNFNRALLLREKKKERIKAVSPKIS
jgi:hypothetical protein